jgi:hypothetical protein
MTSQTATHVEPRARSLNARQVVLSLLGPLTALLAVGWAIAQPWRITLLHPHGETFWWLAVQPPLWILVAALGFHLFVARPLIEDLDR